MNLNQPHKPRVGIPYRTRNEELNNVRGKYEKYVEAVTRAGGEVIEISLKQSPEAFRNLVRSLDAIVLPGSPADVDPALYHAPPHAKAAAPDKDLEQTDGALLSHAVAEHKPLLAICYGVQFLNVEFGGSLLQHVSAEDPTAELKTTIPHPLSEQKASDFVHPIRIEPGSRLAQLAGVTEAAVNYSARGRWRGRSRRMDRLWKLDCGCSVAPGENGRRSSRRSVVQRIGRSGAKGSGSALG
jgi:gamma-glutamyl-gamma-aminobutyrate hydrolase PuuD